MEVYDFPKKTYLKRLDESEMVLKTLQMNPVPASQVRSAWANFIELQIEPTGWYALWKISRVTCEDLKLKYPTIVYGKCENVLHKELKAIFNILAVQEADVHLPEQQIVQLEELWPLIDQQRDAGELNVKLTADCIDQLRFFYNNIWFPWDNHLDDNIDWAEQHLRSRFNLAYHIKTEMKIEMANHVKMLIKESNYLEKRREFLEMDLESDTESDVDADENDDENSNTDKDLNEIEKTNKKPITELLQIHIRMITIKNEMELLENPETRKVYATIKFPQLNEMNDTANVNNINNSGNCLCNNNQKSNVFIVLKHNNNLSDEINYLKDVQKIIEKQEEGSFQHELDPKQREDSQQELDHHHEHKTQSKSIKNIKFCTSLQECFLKCHQFDEIYIPIGIHTIELLEYLNIKGKLFGVLNLANEIDDEKIQINDQKTSMDQKTSVNDQKTLMNSGKSNSDDNNKMNCDDDDDVDKNHLIKSNEMTLIDERHSSIIKTTIYDSILLIISVENFTATNIIFDCRNVRTGIIIRNGCSVTFKNCKFLGPQNKLRSTNIGIVAGVNSKLTIIDCLISDFGNGISLHEKSMVTVQNSIIKNCINGIEMVDNCKLDFKSSASQSLSSIIHSCKYGISYETKQNYAMGIYQNCTSLISNHHSDSDSNIELGIKNDCIFYGQLLGNVNLFKNKYLLYSSDDEKYEIEDDNDDDDNDDDDDDDDDY